MFSYYGSKSKIVDLYPKPMHDKIIEPFAGSARYSLKYFDRDVLLVDKYEVVVGIWKYLQSCSRSDILRLPNLKYGDRIVREDFDCIEQAWLMSFIIKMGTCWPELVVSKWAADAIPSRKSSIANQLFKIKHWVVELGDYRDMPNKGATWFIDPPYVHGGEKYKHGNSKLDYSHLADWSKSRQGQVIVCENTKADWLPFLPMKDMQGSIHKTTEAIWSNHPTAFDWQQQQLFRA